MQNFFTLPKKYFYDTKSKNLILAYYAQQETITTIDGKTIKIPIGYYTFIDLNGKVQILEKEKFENRFVACEDKYGLFECQDINITTLNLKILKKNLVSMSMPSQKEIELVLENGKALNLTFLSEKVAKDNFKLLKSFLSLANKIL